MLRWSSRKVERVQESADDFYEYWDRSLPRWSVPREGGTMRDVAIVSAMPSPRYVGIAALPDQVLQLFAAGI